MRQKRSRCCGSNVTRGVRHTRFRPATVNSVILVTLYGPPAVGKLTIGQHLAQLSGYRLLHNHLTIDVARAIFDYGTAEYFGLCDSLRLETVAAGARSRLQGMILTFCMATEGDQRFLERCATIAQETGGQALFVQLQAPQATLEERVTAPDRQRYSKLMSVEVLRSQLDKYDFNRPIRNFATLKFDTSACAADQVASKIMHALTGQAPR
jgi:hypothetical protein